MAKKIRRHQTASVTLTCKDTKGKSNSFVKQKQTPWSWPFNHALTDWESFKECFIVPPDPSSKMKRNDPSFPLNIMQTQSPSNEPLKPDELKQGCWRRFCRWKQMWVICSVGREGGKAEGLRWKDRHQDYLESPFSSLSIWQCGRQGHSGAFAGVHGS